MSEKRAKEKRREQSVIPEGGKQPDGSLLFIAQFKGGKVSVSGFPDNLDMCLNMVRDITSAIVGHFIKKASGGKVDMVRDQGRIILPTGGIVGPRPRG